LKDGKEVNAVMLVGRLFHVRIVINLSVCVSYLWNRWTDLDRIFCADPLWPCDSVHLWWCYVLLVLWMKSRWPSQAVWHCVAGLISY